MADNVRFFEQFLDDPVPLKEAEASVELDAAIDEFPCYAVARGPRPSLYMLEFRTLKGECLAFDYNWLGRAIFQPSKGMVLHFDRDMVHLAGRNLRPLYENLLRRRIIWIQEIEAFAAAQRPANETMVTGIKIESASQNIL